MADKNPIHIGIILDGNRRFAKRLMLRPWKGHEWGAEKVKELLRWCKGTGVKYLTLYSLSAQNIFSRPKREMNFLLKIFEREFSEIAKKSHEAHKNKVRVKVIGRTNILPKSLQDAIAKAEKSTKNYNDYFLNLAVAYGGQEEITDAIIGIAKKVSAGAIKPEQINEELISRSLYTDGTPYPDMIIRTGGEKRLSNFLLWQSAYSELFFVDKLWPEFTKEDFLKTIEEFKQRQRRFGK
ncbi:MAG: di-trans,poly-cis-decaprenylcistransferase [Nanoarchaeota archaeon]|nr:di-trans,poly-cis-decaprenylcistransferase [Nanoarchaeota archaeon]